MVITVRAATAVIAAAIATPMTGGVRAGVIIATAGSIAVTTIRCAAVIDVHRPTPFFEGEYDEMSLIAVTASIALTSIAPGLIAPAAAQHRPVHRGPVHHARPVCHWESHHHHRVRVCR